MPPPPSHPPRPQPRTPSGPSWAPTDTDGDGDNDKDEEASIAGDDRPLLRRDGDDCWLPMKKGTEQITTVFKSCYKWYVPYFHLAPEETINTWWDEWKLEELGRTPSQSEVFMRTHTKKKDRQWVDQHAEDTNDCRLPQERAGLRTCKVPSRLKPLVYDSDDVSTASGPIDMREQVTLLIRELTQQVEEHRQEVQELRQQHAAQITRLQSSFDTQSVEFNRWKSTVSQMYSFMQNMQAGSATASSAGMPSPIPPPPLQHELVSATHQPQPDGERSPHDDSDYI
ncbi:hypothetical protein PIB30_094829 [Stylosanthes scabra]|uniref:Uncharacterized protein n=1 Tax=Stylosanthes scabra TaxID=79078 RepID=A0ABU6TWZ1_9FABA|nr:hypothetical protein [Stylosanthes scabra]